MPHKGLPPNPGDSLDVSRVEHNNLEWQVQDNRRRIERLGAKIDALTREVAALTKLVKDTPSR